MIIFSVERRRWILYLHSFRILQFWSSYSISWTSL